MKLCRFRSPATPWPSVGLLVDDSTLLDLTDAGVARLAELLDAADLPERIAALSKRSLRRVPLDAATLLAPVDRQEVWAAGVTYLRSKKARMEESDFSATAYDRVYDAARPEIFFKSVAEKVVATGGEVGIRSDARWNVPEPELALVLNSRGDIVGHTIGNDMSSRDIEGENLLYLPQAKVYRASCALGPFITIGASEAEARTWTISIRIVRDGTEVFAGQTGADQIKRSFPELAGYLCRSQEFPHGAVLLTGTGVVPANEFTLAAGDVVRIAISGIGELVNTVAVV
jgi:2-dehydro-3-deoxy-D-arabinonate dehydratase